LYESANFKEFPAVLLPPLPPPPPHPNNFSHSSHLVGVLTSVNNWYLPCLNLCTYPYHFI